MSDKPEDAICPVCGYYCLGKGGFGCIDKPSMQPSAPPEEPMLEELYQELLMAVQNKIPGESRHQTALRIIKESEKSGESSPQEAV